MLRLLPGIWWVGFYGTWHRHASTNHGEKHQDFKPSVQLTHFCFRWRFLWNSWCFECISTGVYSCVIGELQISAVEVVVFLPTKYHKTQPTRKRSFFNTRSATRRTRLHSCPTTHVDTSSSISLLTPVAWYLYDSTLDVARCRNHSITQWVLVLGSVKREATIKATRTSRSQLDCKDPYCF